MFRAYGAYEMSILETSLEALVYEVAIIGQKWKEVNPTGKTSEFEAYYVELAKLSTVMQVSRTAFFASP